MDPQSHTFPNGVRLAVMEMPHHETVAMGLFLTVGARHDHQSKAGIAHFDEHLYFGGTERRTNAQIVEEIEGNGGYINGYTTREATVYHAKMRARNLPVVADVLLDSFTGSTFPQHRVDNEKGTICEELRMDKDQPAAVAGSKMDQMLWPRHALGRPIVGYPDTVQNFTQADCFHFRDTHYHSGNLWICVAGKTTLQEVKQVLEPWVEKIPSGQPSTFEPASPQRFPAQLMATTKKIEQFHFSMGMRASSEHDEVRFAQGLGMLILGGNMSSRLFQEVRERHGAAYDIGASFHAYSDAGVISIEGAVNTSKLVLSLEKSMQQVELLANKGPEEAELARAKNYILGHTEMAMEGPSGQMTRMGSLLCSYGRITPYDQLQSRIEQVTTTEVRDSLRDLLSREKLYLSVVGPSLNGQTAQLKSLVERR